MRTLVTALFALGLVFAWPSPASAVDEEETPTGVVRVIKVEGVLDPILADFVRDAVREAGDMDAEALVIQLDSSQSVLSQRQLDALTLAVAHAPVPVAVWVGESGAEAIGGAYALVRAADITGVAPGVRLGDAPDPILADPDPLANRVISGDEALELGLVDVDAPVLPAFIAELDGRVVGGRHLETARPGVDEEGEPTREPTVVTTFSQPSLLAQLLHGVTSPSVAYLLLITGLLLLVFEFFTAGIGIAGAVGAISLVLASFGLGALPTRPLGLALVALGVFGYSVDIQAGAPRTWTVIGTASLVAGSVTLFGDGFSVPLLTLGAVLLATVIFVISAMPSVVRTRFSTPTIGREAMIGEMGTAVDDVDPDGTVEVRGAAWRARTNRATPISAGAAVRVVGLEGIVLEVEPEEGGARDYRH